MRRTGLVAALVLLSGLGLSGTVTQAQTISIADASVTEADAGTGPLVFTLTLSPASALPVDVDWNTTNGTATHQDGDYLRVWPLQTVAFAPLQTTMTVSVTIYGDGTIEPDETFFIDLSNPTNATLADSQAVGTIVNDDPVVTINDVRRPEGDSGTTPFVFEVRLSAPSPSAESVDWATTDGTATTADADYALASGTVTFPAFSTVETVSVDVNGDPNAESDEIFYVDLSGGGGGRFLKARGVGMILDDDATNPPVEAFGVISDSTLPGPTGRHTLQWLTPAGAAGAFVIRFRTVGAPCQPTDYPNDPTIASPDPLVPGTPILVPDTTQSLSHTLLTLNQWYCYSFWVDYGGGTYAGPVTMKAQAFDSTGAVKRKYYTGTATLAAPTVTVDAVVVPSNDSYIHAMRRDTGTWPATWRPRKLESVVHHRVPYGPRSGGGWQALVATEDGWVHAVDTATGTLWWSTWLPEGAARGAPAAIFTAFGGAYDYVVVGTSANNNANRLYALDPDDGTVLDAFPMNQDAIYELEAVLGMPSVDYANRRVFFAARTSGTSSTLKGLELGPLTDALKVAWEYDTADINGSVVLHNGRVYAGDVNGEVFSVRASDGGDVLSVDLGSEVKGFLFPDRRGSDLYCATDTATANVWAITDTGTGLNHDKWGIGEPILVDPSVVLYHPGTDDIYVGVRDRDGDGLAPLIPAVVKISAVDGSIVSWVDLEPTPFDFDNTIGPPSLDWANGMLYVGSVAGIIYAVDLAGF